MAKTKPVEKPQISAIAAEIARATEVEDIKGSQRIAVTAWVDSNSAIEFLVPEWFIKVVGYKFDAQPADTMKRIGRAMVTPAAGAANNAQRATGLKVKGGTKLIGAKITIPTPKAETGKQTEVFGSFSKKVGTKNITVKKRGLRVPGHLSNKAIQYWLFVTSTTVPQWFERGSYRFQVAGLNPAPALEGLGTAHKGTTA